MTTSEKMQYDARGRLTTQQLALSLPASWNITSPLPTDYQMALTYNDANQLVMTQTSTNPSGQGYTVTDLYNSTTGVLTGLSNQKNATTPDLASLIFNQNALVASVNFQTSSQTALAQDQFSYDGDLRPAESNAQWQSGSGSSGQIFDETRSYDPASNVISETTTQAQVSGSGGGTETQDYCYDEQDRLVWAGNSGTEPAPGNGTCGTAPLGNTLSGASYSNAYSYTYLNDFVQAPFNGAGSDQYLYCTSAAPHQLSGVYAAGSTCASKSGQVYAATYDAWGNVSTRTLGSGSSADTATLSYDLLNHFIEWTDQTPGKQSQAWDAYDSSGNRVLQRATTGGTTSITVYAFGMEEHLYDGSGNLQGNTYYYSLGGRLIGELTNSGTSMLLTDALGSVLASFSNLAGSAAVQANRTYGPYGNVQYTQGSFSTSKGFTGQYTDAATGLDYYGARYYDPKASVFLSADSVQGDLQGMNPYTYVGGNPETMTDPTGNMYAPPQGDGESQSHVQQDAYNYVTSNQLGSSGLPAALEAYLYDHATWEEAEVYANYHLHTSTRLLLSEEAADVIHIKGINWNANNRMRQAFLMINGLALTETMAVAGMGIEGPMSTIDDIAHVVTESRDPLESDTHMSVDDKGNVTVSGDESTGNEGEGGPCSFTPQTPVATNHGEQAIGTLKVGEKVWAYNPKTHKMELEAVQHVWINHDNDLVDLTLTTTTHAPHSTVVRKTSEVIHTNQKHPFFTLEQGFVPVAQLHLGMHVLRADGNVGIVTGWKVVPGTKVMYNLTVAQDHTFTVGAGQWVVHNTAGPSGGSCGGASPDDLSNSANADSGKNGLTNVGRALQKHLADTRTDASKWSPYKPSKGNPWGYNAMGKAFIDDLITNPDTIWKAGGGYINGFEGEEYGVRGAEWVVIGGVLTFRGLL